MRSARALQKIYVRTIPYSFFAGYGSINTCWNRECPRFTEYKDYPQVNVQNNCIGALDVAFCPHVVLNKEGKGKSVIIYNNTTKFDF